MDSSAQVLAIGAGIAGCSTAYHLAQLGLTDVVVVEQGPLFATGGSSSHAPVLVFQTNGSQTMTQLARYTVERFTSQDLDGRPSFHRVGGIEVAVRYGVGSYQHRAIPVHTSEFAATATSGNGAEAPSGGGDRAGMASVHPSTPEDFKQPWSDACELLPVLEQTDIAEDMNQRMRC